MKHVPNALQTSYFRNFIFGVEDSLVSTVGLISGVAIAGVDKQTVFLTGVVLIFVEAISMSAGTYLSESSAHEFDRSSHQQPDGSWLASLIMFFSYFISGFIPLSPYLLFERTTAFWTSICLSLVFLFVLGLVSATISRIALLKSGMKMLFVGGLAIGVGVLVGHVLKLP